MKTKYILFISALITSGIAMTAASSWGAPLECVRSGRGFAVKNSETGMMIGEHGNSYFELYHCREAVASANSRYKIVCANLGSGSAIYNYETNERLGSDVGRNYLHDVAHCKTAIRYASNGIVCVPRNSGTGIFDISRNKSIGDGFFYDVNDCTWASISASSSSTDVCAVARSGYIAIFDRELNAQSQKWTWTSAKECRDYLVR